MKDEDVLATAKFHLFGKTVGGKDYNSTVKTSLCKSHAFAYGNQTCMVWEWENGWVDSFDTRYDDVSVETFKEFAQKCLRNHCTDSIAIEYISD